MNEEKAESAKIVPGKPLFILTLREGSERKVLFPLHHGAEHLAISASAFSATSAVKFLIFSRPGSGKKENKIDKLLNVW
jgi:hypothetical protein